MKEDGWVTEGDIQRMPYADFVAFLEQDNSPPNGLPTIHEWISHAGIDASSRVLDLACSTGFSGRTITAQTGCSVYGIDLSFDAVSEARRKARTAGLEQTDFLVGDATALPYPNAHFDVTVAGASFGFFHQGDLALDEVHRVMVPDGRLCIANFTYHSQPTQQILDKVASRTGFRPDQRWSRDYWNSFFARRFILVHEYTSRIEVLSPRDVACYVALFINSHAGRLADMDACIRKAAFHRLLLDRLVFNEHARYQMRNIQVWKRQA